MRKDNNKIDSNQYRKRICGVYIWFSEDEKRKLKDICNKSGLSMSEYIRRKCLNL